MSRAIVFGRPRAFDIECPLCGRVEVIRPHPKKALRRVGGFDPRSSSWECRDCGTLWIVGLALRRPKPGPRRPALPRDQVPNKAQLERIRAWEREQRGQGGSVVLGKVVTDNMTRPVESNYVAECTCRHLDPPLQFTRVRDPDCPIHGDDEVYIDGNGG